MPSRRMLGTRTSSVTVDVCHLDYVIYISEYAFNVLETMDKIRKKEAIKGISQISGEILHELKNNIRVANNLTLEAYELY